MGAYVVLSMISIAVSLLLVFQISKRFPGRESYRNFKLVMLSVALWNLLAIFELLSVSLNVKVMISKLEYFSIVSIPVLFFYFSLEYSGMQEILKKRWFKCFWIIPVITLLLVMTNEMHGLVWSKITSASGSGSKLVLQYDKGFWYTVNQIYGYLLIIMGILQILSALRKSKTLKNHFSVIVGIAVPLIGNGLYTTRIISFDYTPPAFSFMCISFGWAILSGFLDKSLALSETIYLHLEEAIIFVDENMHAVSVNPYAKKILKSKLESNAGQPFEKMLLFREDMGISLRDDMDEAFETAIDIDGANKWFSVKINSVVNNGIQSGWIICLNDISEKKNYENELRKEKAAAESANVAKSQFLANISHEIRTPLNGIIGFTELLSQTALGDLQSDYVKEVRSASVSLLHIVNEVLDFSKIEAGKIELENAEFSLSELVSGVVGLVMPEVRKKGLSITFRIENEVFDRINGDSIRLGQVLNNLMGNAVKFTEAGSISLDVTLISEFGIKQELRFRVSDTGIGISAEARQKLFGLFVQADNSTTRKYGGTGLGLVIAKRIIELMGGGIWVESEEGMGSSFIFTVTLDKAKVPDAGDVANRDMMPDDEFSCGAETVRVLLTEDMAANRKLALLMLGKLGYECDIACNGLEAVEACGRLRYGLILMDCQMPVMDGYTATVEIRRSELNADTPIVAMTADAMGDARERCFAAGMDDYISKPVTMRKLSAVIMKWRGRLSTPEQFRERTVLK